VVRDQEGCEEDEVEAMCAVRACTCGIA
jgi:hypothetical protein